MSSASFVVSLKALLTFEDSSSSCHRFPGFLRGSKEGGVLSGLQFRPSDCQLIEIFVQSSMSVVIRDSKDFEILSHRKDMRD